ncbi:hypothetical protein ACHAWF_015806 [Thalassiosira exigua]
MSNASYDAQLRIRRDAEERSIAHQDLGSWIGSLDDKGRTRFEKNAKPNPQKDVGSRNEDDRVRGNNFFAQGKYEDAVRCYTRCLDKADVQDLPLVLSNRAMAHLKLKRWAQAEADATSALQADPRHPLRFKTYQRRGVARLHMGKLRAAMGDGCAAEDHCTDEGLMGEIRKLSVKIEKALVEATRRAPRRKMPIAVV